MDDILNVTLKRLLEFIDIRNLQLKDFFIGAEMTLVKLSDNSLGTAANFDVQIDTDKHLKFSAIRESDHIRKLINKDPLLLKYLQNLDCSFKRSLKLAIVSALSQPLLNKNEQKKLGLNYFKVKKSSSWQNRLFPLLKYKKEAVLIGYGGGLHSLLKAKILNLYISDYMFKNRVFLMQSMRELARLKKLYNFAGKIKLSNGLQNEDILKKANLVLISGSALANNTMEDLLNNARRCETVIVQGPSASIYPVELFSRGVTDLFTNIKKEADIFDYKIPGGHTRDDSNYIHIYK